MRLWSICRAEAYVPRIYLTGINWNTSCQKIKMNSLYSLIDNKYLVDLDILYGMFNGLKTYQWWKWS